MAPAIFRQMRGRKICRRVIDLRAAEDRRDVVHRAVQALAEGGLVALPTETVYGLAVSALNEAAIGRLLEAKGRSGDEAVDRGD